ncbi:ADR148Wp [Eremothecium gossypii ATCC 10895]|uniref:ADR148Wp n=1 Tax=Eremothecium gossypii (strain ATCC 10895 / CBS 109.51 / FGSC 9923 / NRRL Y-1056) TaxID=284811 RepID=Q759X5_EREGS|nr:ADR148Wp [Eremothecium gossypii ATCC 10895]AAS52068.1 ADR148Wp [Eremothecium gossypii ATCC 10895]AEY96367.1 FADR148Wp [Eremothecium gossypii FDAG1]
MSNSLEERLKSNSNAFDGLLSLIPAKYYYDDKTQEQWRASKKTKTQTRLDKRKKLNPVEQDQESSSALEVKRKREEEAKPVVLPGEKLQQMNAVQQAATAQISEEDDAEAGEHEEVEHEDEETISVVFDDEGNAVDGKHAAAGDKPAEDKDTSGKEKRQKNMEALRAKLQERIRQMKEKRKAPGTRVDGAPSSREAILAQRKKREELRKRRQEEERQRQDDSGDESESDSESDMDDQPPTKQRKRDAELSAKDVIFQNIVFDDGSRATSDLQRLRRTDRKKGPAKNDIKAHLKLAEARTSQLESKDELQQIMIKEKEKWKRAMLQAEGVRLKDDEKLLRKALKRKEAKKRKSAIEWKEREQTVTTSISEKQKRREENLAIRKSNKGVKKSKQQKMKRKFTGAIVPKKRAGFEGRLKSGKRK